MIFFMQFCRKSALLQYDELFYFTLQERMVCWKEVVVYITRLVQIYLKSYTGAQGVLEQSQIASTIRSQTSGSSSTCGIGYLSPAPLHAVIVRLCNNKS